MMSFSEDDRKLNSNTRTEPQSLGGLSDKKKTEIIYNLKQIGNKKVDPAKFTILTGQLQKLKQQKIELNFTVEDTLRGEINTVCEDQNERNLHSLISSTMRSGKRALG